jgi:heme A synthase
LSPNTETLIEYTHRVTSGLALLFTLVLLFFSRKFEPGHKVRKAAIASGLFIVLEALIGAGLVLFDLVGGNTSATRALAAAVHLSNTYFLLAALTITALWAHRTSPTFNPPGRLRWALIAVALLGLIVIGATGAITALGDTLFPARSLAAGIAEKFDSTKHFLVRLRIIHPLAAILVGTYLLFGIRLGYFVDRDGSSARVRSVLIGLIVLQWIAGAINVVLLAPIWLQILHLLIADMIWIFFIIYLERGLFIRSTVTGDHSLPLS